eukprot:TRINITY_DN6702_c1_g1_i1.p1 TRINITY_DN6702_c1_g1~~TRINITY_DN6702_c1_g1_i1.p1  ORF type:complete len:444 (+),score=137.16 TRINITY_DN6702_c1_g1_i1:88-1419(+)
MTPESSAGDAAARPASVPPFQHPFACVMINGSQLIRCRLPAAGEESSETAAATTQHPASSAGDGVHIDVAFLSPNLVPQANVHWHGILVVDGTREIDLGRIRSRRQHERRTEVLSEAPQRYELRVRAEQIDPSIRIVSAEERELIAAVKGILEDPQLNPRHGSMSSSQVRERAEAVPVYKKVIKGDVTWGAFIASHPEIFTVFQYGEHEIKERRLLPFVSPEESRIVLKPEERLYNGAEDAADGETSVEQELRDFLISLLSERDYEQRELLNCIAEHRDLTFYLAPTFSLLMRFLNRHRATFQWTTDPGQPTRISLVNSDRGGAGSRASQQLGAAARRRRPPPGAGTPWRGDDRQPSRAVGPPAAARGDAPPPHQQQQQQLGAPPPPPPPQMPCSSGLNPWAPTFPGWGAHPPMPHGGHEYHPATAHHQHWAPQSMSSHYTSG